MEAEAKECGGDFEMKKDDVEEEEDGGRGNANCCCWPHAAAVVALPPAARAARYRCCAEPPPPLREAGPVGFGALSAAIRATIASIAPIPSRPMVEDIVSTA